MCIFSLFGGGGSSAKQPAVLAENTTVAEANKTASTLSDRNNTNKKNATISSLKIPIQQAPTVATGTNSGDTNVGLNIPS